MSSFGPTMDKSLGSSEDRTAFNLDERFCDGWGRIRDTLESILSQQNVPRRTWNERFSDVYDITTNYPQDYVDRLYDSISVVLREHVKRVCFDLTKTWEPHLLDSYLHHWQNYYESLKYINKLVGHLNSAVVRPAKINDSEFPMIHLGIPLPDYSDDKVEVMELGCQLWARNVIKPMQDGITRSLLTLISRDREHGAGIPMTQTDAVKSVVDSLVAIDEFKGRCNLKTYCEVFEVPYIQCTGDHYKSEAVLLVNTTSCSVYVKKVLDRLHQEEFRARRLCHSSTIEKIRAEVQSRMVNDHMGFILSESRNIIEARSDPDLVNMYEVLRLCPDGIATLRQYFTSFVEEKAREAVGSSSQLEPQDLVESLDAIFGKYSTMVGDVFKGDGMFKKAIDDAIKIVLNQQSGVAPLGSSSAELIARYCDFLLRKSVKNASEVEEKLDGAIRIFRFLDDKDVFQRYYSRMMAKRLINKQYISSDVETNMVGKLRDACGCDYTGKLMRMLRDMHSSAQMMDNFTKDCPLPEFRQKCELFINILTSGVWPIPSFDVPFRLPAPLIPVIRSFNKFHQNRFTGRRLTWIFQLGSVDVKLNFVKRPVIATMNVQQLAICFAFNDMDVVSFSHLRELTQMTDDHLDVNVDCLVQQQLVKRYDDMEDGPSLMLNLEYAPKKPRIKISVPQTKEQPQQEKEETERSTGDMRQVFLQAAVCRIMKARGTMSQQNLVEEVREAAQPRFVASQIMIKKALDTLLEKDYIKRSLTAPDVYEYMT